MSARLGILATHPIQYHTPWFRYLTERASLTVFYAHRSTPEEQAAAGFGVEFDWDSDLLNGYEYHWLRAESSALSTSRFLRYNTPEIYDLIRNGKFTGFLVIGWNYRSAWQACQACRKYGVPVFTRGDSQLRNSRSQMTLLLKRAIYPHGLRRFNGHLYVGARNREYLINYGVPARNLYFAPHFVDDEYFRASAELAASSGQCLRLRRKVGIPEDAFVFAFVGKLIDKKRPQDFLEGFKRYLDGAERADAYALVVGDGPLKQHLMKQAESLRGRVYFTGFVNQSEIPAWYRVADVVVLPSDARESWGLVVNEAAACGRPAIVTEDVGCRPDLIDNQYTGFSYDLADVAQLADRMAASHRVCVEKPKAVQRALSDMSCQYSIPKATEGLMSAISDWSGRG